MRAGEQSPSSRDQSDEAGLGFQLAVDGLVGAGEPHEPVAFDGGVFPATAFSALATWSLIPRRVRRARSALYW